MASASKPAPDGYSRRLKPDDPMLIESRCDYCGLVITGSAMHDLTDHELTHRQNCPEKANRSTS